MKILVVDDEQNIRQLMSRYLQLDGIESVGAENGFSAQRKLSEESFDACLVDLKMPGMDGLELIAWIRDKGFRMPVIMMSAHGEISDAVQALKTGAQDYIVKPFDPEELTIKLKSLVQAQKLMDIEETDSRKLPDHAFIGESPQILRIKELIQRIASSTSTVLITGESGTGKEVVARCIHEQSSCSQGPFVAVNAGALPENLLESELFGYEKGAFTGAASRKIGMFELAGGGTLFLDEIGDMPLILQVKILRALQEHCITRLGGTQVIPCNARIICATNRCLENMVREGTFREDLFYRLNVVRINIPPLRERKEDIPLLCAWILRKFNEEMGRHFTGFTPQALEKLREHSFYGNVRELENVLERAAIFTDSNVIGTEFIDLNQNTPVHYAVEGFSPAPSDDSEIHSLQEIEKFAIERSLRRWEGNRTKSAEELGISRRTLLNKIAEYGLKL